MKNDRIGIKSHKEFKRKYYLNAKIPLPEFQNRSDVSRNQAAGTDSAKEKNVIK